jgi:hypothetical protein
MRRPQYTITPAQIHRHAARLCQRQLKLRARGPKCTAGVVLTVLFYAAARITSIAAACAALLGAPALRHREAQASGETSWCSAPEHWPDCPLSEEPYHASHR